MGKLSGALLASFIAVAASITSCGHDDFVAGRVCAAGDVQACYTGADDTQGVGPCHGGHQTCLPSEIDWGPCEGQVIPKHETCTTTEDDNCDGRTDDGDDCACKAGSIETCYGGPAGTEDVGACKGGVRTCTPAGTWGICAGQITPVEESCANARDDDCDGHTCAGASWAELLGAADAQEPAAIAVDAEGRIFVAGTFTGAIDTGGALLISAGMSDGFVAAFDAQGKPLWTKQFGGDGDDEVTSLAVSTEGEIAVGGSFASFKVIVGADTLTSSGGRDAFVAKLDGATGDPLWARRFGGDGSAMGDGDQITTSVAFAPGGAGEAGDVLAIGTFSGAFGCCIASQGSSDVFVVRLTGDGAGEWFQTFDGPLADVAGAVACDQAGDAYVVGSFAAGLTIGGKLFTTTKFSDRDLFVAKLDPGGGVQWAGHFGDAQLQEATAVAVDAQGNAIVAGRMAGAIHFGGAIADVGTPGSTGERAFAMELSAAGAPVWARAFGDGTANAVARSIAIDAKGFVLLAGTFGGAIDFGGGAMNAAGTADAFLAKLDGAGGFYWARAFGQMGVQDEGRAVAASPKDSTVVLAATVLGTIDFGTGKLTSAGSTDVGVAAFEP